MPRRTLFILSFFLLMVSPVIASVEACQALVEDVLESLEDACADTSRNEACYGSVMLEATPQADIDDFQFDAVGDIESVANIRTLHLSPMDSDAGMWGVALMRLQLRSILPGTLPGENVTFLTFGDVEIENVADEDAGIAPMQAFFLRTGIGEPECAEAPQDGLIIQTPEDRGEVRFSVNGVEVALGSTAYIQTPENAEIVFQVLDGAAAVRCAGETAAVLSGTQVGCPLDENFVTSGPPGEVEPIVPKQLDNILGILPDSVSVSPRSTEEIDEISRLWNDGLPLCDGAEFLPACDDLIETLNGEKCPINSNNDPECGNTDVSIWESVPDEAPDFEVETSGETGATGEATGIVTYVGTFTFEQKLLFNTSDCAYTEPLSIEGEFSLWVNFDEMRSTAMFSGENSGTTDYTCSLSTGATNWDLNLSSHTGGSITLNDDGTFTFETDGYAPTKYSFTYQHCEGIDDIPVTCYDPANIPISQPVTVTGTITMSDGSGSGSINFASGEEFQVSTWQTDSIVMP